MSRYTELPKRGEVVYVPRRNLETGEWESVGMTVTQVMCFADNSTEVWGTLPDGREHHTMWVAPHGDVC